MPLFYPTPANLQHQFELLSSKSDAIWKHAGGGTPGLGQARENALEFGGINPYWIQIVCFGIQGCIQETTRLFSLKNPSLDEMADVVVPVDLSMRRLDVDRGSFHLDELPPAVCISPFKHHIIEMSRLKKPLRQPP